MFRPSSPVIEGNQLKLLFISGLTSRYRPKLAPYLMLKNSKRTSKCQSILFNSTRKSFRRMSQCRKKTERGTLWDFPTSILSQNSKQSEGVNFVGLSRPVLYVTLETFLVHFLGPTGTVWCLLKNLYNFW